MERIRKRKPESWLLKGFFIFSLLFPAFYSPYTDVYQSAYYAKWSWAYVCLTLYLVLCLVRFWREGGERPWKKPGFWLYLGVLAAYNLFSLYFNHKYLHWYWEQINNTVAFVTFLVLACVRPSMDERDEEGDDNIRFLMGCIVLSNVASIVYYFMGYTKLLICNNQFVFFELPADFYESRHYWIYSHKSEYALMLVAFVALLTAYRKKFRNLWTFFAGQAVLLFCLYLTHSWTGIAGVLLIFIGAALDGVEWKDFKLKKWYLAVAAALAAVCGAVGWEILKERNIWTLGNRVYIWRSALDVIKKHPEGWGLRFGESVFVAEPLDLMVTNAHNIFLNAVLRFSVPVGICFTVLFLGIAVYSVRKAKSFLAAGMWLALLVLLDMDYALQSPQMGLLFLVVYLVCFKNKREQA
ncbi:O-antigen ligase family protein [Anaerosacchariphilus sp. NSJ-68]|uniref:O-antigen ligase family protein n=2 Tax=Lachnospiraceae TaxID=186803 RepID=A0A923LD34_9FIRM|nr:MULTISPECIES: O-antigen ligase family protein [Lachnospiraceae]MBC5660348.1 O-antigen ligase family protein [Anaerosacchariphilus hominis]MBC5697804.1 O-antigen ligase family protein [Roseburia difficilis]